MKHKTFSFLHAILMCMALGCITLTSCGDDEEITPSVMNYSENENNTGWHDYVDLGLPSKTQWATCNIGASKPEGYGSVFAWGETTGYFAGKENFSWYTYKWSKGNNNSLLTKYCTSSNFGYDGFTDGKKELVPTDDAAYANWGKLWRMPSIEQFEELINSKYTTITLTKQKGVNGLVIESKINGRKIFLPTAGRYNNSTQNSTELSIVSIGKSGYYWSRTLDEKYPEEACYLAITSNYVNADLSIVRFVGCSIRPVRSQ